MEWLNKVPWLDRSAIAQKAQATWAAFEKTQGRAPAPPYPVEALIEKHLGLSLEYDDLDQILGEPEVLGATWVGEGRIIIHQELAEGPEGRMAFTGAHEVGHWVLHKEFLEKMAGALLRRGGKKPLVVCRRQEAKLRGEWQADYFAACLLMPAAPVRLAFRDCFGADPLVMYNRKSSLGKGARAFLPVLDPCLETAQDLAGEVIAAGGFSNCSRLAMRYRLADLGLLVDQTGGGY